MYFRVEGTEVRLAGTIHMLPKSFPDLPGWVRSAYEWAEVVYLEGNLQDLRWVAYLPQGTTLEEKLGLQLFAQIRAVWPTPSPLGELNSLKPWLVPMTLPILGGQWVEGVEPNITHWASEDKRPLEYLEAMTEFSAIGDAIPDEAYREVIARMLSNLSYYQDGPMRVFQAWSTQRLQEIESTRHRTLFGEFPVLGREVIDRRNANWMPKIIEATQTKKRSLICMGALHLVGLKGVLALLRGQTGLDVTPAF